MHHAQGFGPNPATFAIDDRAAHTQRTVAYTICVCEMLKLQPPDCCMWPPLLLVCDCRYLKDDTNLAEDIDKMLQVSQPCSFRQQHPWQSRRQCLACMCY